MPLLIDGHNLIGAGLFADIQLSDEDDEVQLVARLKVWKSRYKGKFMVVFDRGIQGGRDMRLGGAGVEVIFATSPQEADDLIRRRMRRHPSGLVLVTNDVALLREAAELGIERWTGQEFVSRMGTPAAKRPPTTAAAAEAGAEPNVHLSETEVDEWLRLFAQAGRRAPSRKKTPRPKPPEG